MSAKSPYQVFIIAPELMTDRSLSLSSRVVLGRLGGYTKRGAQICWPTNQALALECGLAIHSVSDAIKELSQREIITTWNTLFNGKKIRYIKIIYSSPAYIPCGSNCSDSSSNELSENELSSNENSNNEQFNNSSNELSNCSSNELSSSIHTLDTTKEVQVDISAHAQQQKSNRPKVIYPQCKEECYSLFTEQYQELISDYPELANIQINISALKFYNYYSGNRWTIKNRPIKSVEKTAQNWLLREIEKYNDKHGKDNDSPKPTDFALDIIKNTSNNGSPSTINADYEDVTDTQQPLLPNNKENANEQKGKAESTTL